MGHITSSSVTAAENGESYRIVFLMQGILSIAEIQSAFIQVMLQRQSESLGIKAYTMRMVSLNSWKNVGLRWKKLAHFAIMALILSQKMMNLAK